MTTVFIIAGFDINETAQTKFVELKRGLKNNEYVVCPVDISWRRKTPSAYSKEFITFYEEYKTERNIIIGNSFGAVVTLLASVIVRPDEIYLCSLSPYFKEDRGKRPDEYGIKHFGIRRMKDLWAIEFNQLAKSLNQSNTKVIITYGQLEKATSPLLIQRCIEAKKQIKNSKLIELPNVPHSMNDKRYMKSLLAIIAR